MNEQMVDHQTACSHAWLRHGQVIATSSSSSSSAYALRLCAQPWSLRKASTASLIARLATNWDSTKGSRVTGSKCLP